MEELHYLIWKLRFRREIAVYLKSTKNQGKQRENARAFELALQGKI